jgi:hypothetical protein
LNVDDEEGEEEVSESDTVIVDALKKGTSKAKAATPKNNSRLVKVAKAAKNQPIGKYCSIPRLQVAICTC